MENTVPGLSLPPEIFLGVLYLCAGEWEGGQVKKLAGLRLVCKAWKPLVEEVLVRHIAFTKGIEAASFSVWARRSGAGSFVKECVLAPSRLDTVVDLQQYMLFFCCCPNLRKLAIDHLSMRVVIQLACYFPSLQDLVLQHSFTCNHAPKFRDLLPMVSGLSSLKSLSLENTEFGEHDEPLDVALSVLSLRHCIEVTGAISRVFRHSHSTISQYTFTSALARHPHRLAEVSIPSFVYDRSSLSDLTLLDFTRDLQCPIPIPGIPTICVGGARLEMLWSHLGSFLLTFPRLVVMDLHDAIAVSTIPQAEWRALRWIEIECCRFLSPSDFETTIGPWSPFVRVLSLYEVKSVPEDFTNIFPGLKALRVFLDQRTPLRAIQLGWFTPTLEVLCLGGFYAPRDNDLAIVDEAISTNRSPNLRLLVFPRTWLARTDEASEEFYTLCHSQDIEISTTECRFEDWARHLALA